jgi:hypothetical protein
VTESTDLFLVLERLNDVLAGQREMKAELADIRTKVMVLQRNAATRSQFLALTEPFNQFDRLLSTLHARVAGIEARG